MQLMRLFPKASPALAVACIALASAVFMGASASQAASRPPIRFKAAAVAFDPTWGDLDGNISRIVAGLEEVARQGVRLAVLPEQATIGYIFDDFAMVKPYLDTVPGKATAAIEKVTRAHRMYVVVGIAERDAESGLGYNTAALIGPAGYIGKYRKHGLNPQDQRWVSVGNLGFPVFDTELGRITMLICYDDTYWQYGRLALLHDVDIIAWASASDRVTPGTPADQAKGDHSTVANVQYLSAYSGAFVVAATRNGIEENPLTKQRLYYNGGSSIWDPDSRKLAQAPVLPPEVLPSGVHGIAVAEIEPARSAPVRATLLARRRPELYSLLALHRAPTDANAAPVSHQVEITVEGGDPAEPTATWSPPPRGGLAVLPALFRYGPDHPPGDFQRFAEPQGGPSETMLADLAKQGGGYVAGSYPERAGDAVYHTVALAAPSGEIVARYRATHLDSDRAWAKAGDRFVIAPTPIGRIALALGEELTVPEAFGVYSALRADIVAAPSGTWRGAVMEIDPKLFNTPYPPGTPFAPYAAAQLGQFWIAAAGWAAPSHPAALLLGPEPVIATPPRVAGPGELLKAEVTAPWSGTWINQDQLVDGQQPWNTLPLVLAKDSACLAAWRKSAGWKRVCW
jgi:predicted amidohydrolase